MSIGANLLASALSFRISVPQTPRAVDREWARQARSAPHRNRTCNLRFRRPMLYPIELGVRICGVFGETPGFIGGLPMRVEFPHKA
jgi:hypothetical protein